MPETEKQFRRATMTKTETLKMQSKMRSLRRAAIRRFAADHEFEIENTEVSGLTIYSPDRTFYVSEVPHGETFHARFEPGHGIQSDWDSLFAEGVVLGWVDTTLFRTGDNFHPHLRNSTAPIVRALRASATAA
jgi:hypothetical protein